MTAPTKGWHADDTLIRDYVSGVTGATVSSSLEQHLLTCGGCRARLAALPPAELPVAGLDRTWAAIEEGVQAGPRPWFERVLGRLGVPGTDAMLIAAAPAARGAWLVGTSLVLLFALACTAFGIPRGAWLFLVIAPLVPVVGVAVAYGPEVDDSYELSLATPYPALRLILFRTATALLTATPLAVAGGSFLPGPGWIAVTWLLPAIAMVTVTLAASTWVGVTRAAAGVGLTWLAVVSFLAGPGLRGAVEVVDPAVLPLYAVLAVVAAVTFHARSDELNLMGRTTT